MKQVKLCIFQRYKIHRSILIIALINSLQSMVASVNNNVKFSEDTEDI
jgi:hypothetical protein